jgi:transmembrane sensor
MKSLSSHPAPAEEQASLWAARLDGSTLSAADRAELDVWLEADPSHRQLLSTFCQFSADLEQQLPLLAGIREELADSNTAAKTAQPLPWLRWPTLAGATLMAAAVLAVILWQGQPQNQFHNIATPVAQRQEVTLADGTHIELNAQTALVVEFGPDARRVRLASGEAFFRVSRDPDRPFFVETSAGSIRVTGTQFNVRTEAAASLEVTVLEGTVQVRPGGAATAQSLTTGNRLSWAENQLDVVTLSPDQLTAALAWRQGQVVFTGNPLREALSRFARYHGRNLTATDAAANVRVGGLYSLDDLDGFLNAMEENNFSSVPVRVIRGLDGAVQVDVVNRP